MANQKTLRAFGQLLTYPNQHTAEAAELLYIILMSDVPEAAKGISAFGTFIEQHDLWEVEEAFTQTFDVNPACALDIGWHLFGEEYARGMFLVRMREELRKHGLVETTELPDHITHVLAIIGNVR
jgi:nitrate reductase assembly molybdenum cofactor insertion protein NarJ